MGQKLECSSKSPATPSSRHAIEHCMTKLYMLALSATVVIVLFNKLGLLSQVRDLAMQLVPCLQQTTNLSIREGLNVLDLTDLISLLSSREDFRRRMLRIRSASLLTNAAICHCKNAFRRGRSAHWNKNLLENPLTMRAARSCQVHMCAKA